MSDDIKVIVYDAMGEPFDPASARKSSKSVYLLLLLPVVVGLLFYWMQYGGHAPKHAGVRELSIGEEYGDTIIMVAAPKYGPPTDTITVRDDHPWKIKFAAKEYCNKHQWDGLLDRGTRTIWLSEASDDEHVRETLMHELMHLAYSRSDWPPQEFKSENDFVGPSAPVLRSLLIDNPIIAHWMFESGAQ